MAQDNFKGEYNKLLSTHNYRGVANLLRSTSYRTNEARNKAYAMADKFEEEADINDRLLSGASQKQRDAYNFIASGPTKSLDPTIRTDDYSRSFSDAWNNMADENGKIHIKTNGYFGDLDLLDTFIEGSGISINEFGNYGITREENGMISVNTDNSHKINIYNGIDALVQKLVELNNSGQYNKYGERTWYSEAINSVVPYNKTTAYKEMDDMGVFYHPFNYMKKTVDDANKEYSSLMEQQTPYILQTVVTGYMGEDDKQLQLAFSRGNIDLQTFKEQRKILEEKYNRLLQTQNLTQYNVYAINEDNNGSQLLQKVDDPILKNDFDTELKLALADGRVHQSHASNGLMYGTLITIDQKTDSKGNKLEEYPSRTFFVEDLFRSNAENSLRQDTQTDAQLQYARHQTYGHTYRTKDGGRIEDWNGGNDNAVYTDAFGNRRVVSKSEILDIIDDDIVTKRIIEYYQKANLKNQNGRYYTNEYYQVYGNNTPSFEILYNSIMRSSINAMSVKYGSPESEYVKFKAETMASTILQILSKDLNF